MIWNICGIKMPQSMFELRTVWIITGRPGSFSDFQSAPWKSWGQTRPATRKDARYEDTVFCTMYGSNKPVLEILFLDPFFLEGHFHASLFHCVHFLLHQFYFCHNGCYQARYWG